MNSTIRKNSTNLTEAQNSMGNDLRRRLASKKRKNLFSYFQSGGLETEDEESRLAKMFTQTYQ